MAVSYPAPIKYDTRSSARYAVRSLTNDFGDGYQEVTPDGINNIVQGGTLVHELIPQNDNATTVGAGTLRTFLKANCGTSNVVQIKNMMEDPTGANTLNVYLNSWTENYTGVYYTFTISYREAFNV